MKRYTSFHVSTIQNGQQKSPDAKSVRAKMLRIGWSEHGGAAKKPQGQGMTLRLNKHIFLQHG